jgi:hypothetical protein
MDGQRPILRRRTEYYTFDLFTGWWQTRVNGYDGRMVGASKLTDKEQRQTARDLGYGETDFDLHRMNAEHDALHVWWSMERGAASYVIDHEAGIEEWPQEDRVQEEAIVLAIQKTLNDCPTGFITKSFRSWLWGDTTPEKVLGG